MMKNLIVILSIFVIIAGCAGNKTNQRFIAKPAPDTDHALVYIYRAFNPTGADEVPVIFINDKKYSDIPHNGYTYIYLKPGKYKIEARSLYMNSSNVKAGADVNLRGGETYYIKYAITRDSISDAPGGEMFGPLMDIFAGYKDTPDILELMDSEIASRYISNYFYVKPYENEK